jgi:hypothetical protein
LLAAELQGFWQIKDFGGTTCKLEVNADNELLHEALHQQLVLLLRHGREELLLEVLDGLLVDTRNTTEDLPRDGVIVSEQLVDLLEERDQA